MSRFYGVIVDRIDRKRLESYPEYYATILNSSDLYINQNYLGSHFLIADNRNVHNEFILHSEESDSVELLKPFRGIPVSFILRVPSESERKRISFGISGLVVDQIKMEKRLKCQYCKESADLLFRLCNHDEENYRYNAVCLNHIGLMDLLIKEYRDQYEYCGVINLFRFNQSLDDTEWVHYSFPIK